MNSPASRTSRTIAAVSQYPGLLEASLGFGRTTTCLMSSAFVCSSTSKTTVGLLSLQNPPHFSTTNLALSFVCVLSTGNFRDLAIVACFCWSFCNLRICRIGLKHAPLHERPRRLLMTTICEELTDVRDIRGFGSIGMKYTLVYHTRHLTCMTWLCRLLAFSACLPLSSSAFISSSSSILVLCFTFFLFVYRSLTTLACGTILLWTTILLVVCLCWSLYRINLCVCKIGPERTPDQGHEKPCRW